MAFEDGYITDYIYSVAYDPDTGLYTVFKPEGEPYVTDFPLSLQTGTWTTPGDIPLFWNGGGGSGTTVLGYNATGWFGNRTTNEYWYYSSDTLSVGQTVAALQTGTTVITQSSITCFLEGTRIACPDGERAVESLSIGDLVLTASGAALPIRWIGQQTVSATFADPLRSYPVRIAQGALGDGLPKRDLFVSPSHAMLIDGILVQARALVNGTTIAQARPQATTFTYYHLEFETHAIVLAEGAPAESFVDSNESRARFDNHAEFTALYGADVPVAEPCDLPRVTVARQLPRRLAARLASLAAKSDAARDMASAA